MVFNLFSRSPSKVTRSTWGLLVSALFLLFGVTLYWGLDYVIAQIIYSKLTLLKSDSELYGKWVQLPIPLALKVWIFEELNPDDIWAGKKPIVREKGPYVFSVFREKNVLEKDEQKATIKYSEHNLYIFNQSQSIGSLEDKIFTLNVPTVAIADKLGSISNNLPLKGITGVSLELIGNALFEAHKEQLMTQMTVNELLFKGQKVKILQTFETIWTPLSLIGVKFPSTELKDNTYGLFYGQNATFGDPLEIIGQGSEMGSVISWKNKGTLNIWPGDPCNTIRGTDGAMFSPYVDKNRAIYIFIPDLCRSISFNYERNIIFRGINGYRFVLSDSTFTDKDRFPLNDCFCPNNGFPCNAGGITSIGPCKANAPVYLSRPHFLSASKELLEAIEGLSSNSSAHQSFIDLEPTTGTPLRAKVQLQINVYVRRFPFIKTMSDIRKETLYPLVWFEQSAEINEELAQELTNKLIKPLSYVAIVKYAFLSATFLLFLICCVWKYTSRKQVLTNRKSELRKSVNEITRGQPGNTSISYHTSRKRRPLESQRLNDSSRISSHKNKVTTLEPFIYQRPNIP